MDTCLVEQPHGKRHKHEGEDIGCGSDDGGKDKKCDNDMTAITSHHFCTDNTHATHNPAQNGDFKHNSHGKTCHEHGIDVRIQCYGILNHIANLVHTKETECQWKDKKITKQYATEEHDIARENNLQGIMAFPMVQGRRDETEQ